MGNTELKIITPPSVGYEHYFDKTGSTGNSIRFQTDLMKLKLKTFGDNTFSIKAMPMMNTNADAVRAYQLRLTEALPTIQIGKIDQTAFSARLENRTTLKYDNLFKKTDVAQEPRLVLGAKNGDYSASIIPRAKYSQNDPTLRFKDVVASVGKKFGKLGVYTDAYVQPLAFQKGDFSTTNFALGLTYNF